MILASCCATSTWVVTVKGCGGLPLPGATVQMKSGSTVLDTQTSDGSGVATFLNVAGGSYDFVTSKGARFDPDTTSVTISGDGGMDVGLFAAVGYSCCTHCPDSVSNTLFATAGGSAVTLSGPSPWIGSYNGSATNCTGGSVTVRVTLTLTCPTTDGGPWKLHASAPACSHLVAGTPDHADVYWSCATCNSGACTVFADSTAGDCTSPMAISFAMGAIDFGACLFVGDPGQTFTNNLGTPPWGTTVPVSE